MATPSTAKEDRETREPEKHGKSQLVVVELARRRSPDQVRRLRRGHGKLVTDIEDAVDELVKSGTIKAEAQPVVIVVREAALPVLWAFDYDDDDEDEHDDTNDDDEDDEDEDEDEDD